MEQLLDETVAADINRAHEIMAQLVVATVSNPETTQEHRQLVLGNYVLCSALATEGLPWAALHDSFVSGLIKAGADPAVVYQASQTLTRGDELSDILTFGHITYDQKEYGLTYQSKRKSLNPRRFIDAILELGR